MSQWDELSKLIDEDPDEASRRAARVLDSNPDDALQLFVIAEVYSRAERFGLASNLYQRIVQLKPDRPEPWNNLGMCYSGMGENIKARECFHKALNIAPKSAMFMANIAMTHHAAKEYDKSVEWCLSALKQDAGMRAAKNTLGMCYLAQGKWKDGFPLYGASVGGKFRKQIQYQDEPMWDGTHGQTVVFYGEQGLGDEIMYASCIPDAAKVCKPILECDSRLEGLFRRSFPDIQVHGTRRMEQVPWLADAKIDASLPVGQLPQFFRPSPKACPGTPYLVADPERRLQWRALFDSLGPKPKIGIAWSGGSKHNSPQARNLGIDGLRPIMAAIDAEWISLQYKDPTDEIKASGLPIRHYKRACETDDYDDTAAMVAELDMVISVPTAVVHVAGALGVKTHCLTPYEADWAFWSGFAWYSSVELFWKKLKETWNDCTARYVESVHRVRPEATAGIQCPATLNHQELVSSRQHYPAGALSVTAQAARAYGVHV